MKYHMRLDFTAGISKIYIGFKWNFLDEVGLYPKASVKYISTSNEFFQTRLDFIPTKIGLWFKGDKPKLDFENELPYEN